MFDQFCVLQTFNQSVWEIIYIIKAPANRIMTSEFDFMSSHLNISPDTSAFRPPFPHKHPPLSLLFWFFGNCVSFQGDTDCAPLTPHNPSQNSVPFLNKTENLSRPSWGCCTYKRDSDTVRSQWDLNAPKKMDFSSKWIRITFRGNLEWKALPQTHRMYLHRQHRRLMCMSKSVRDIM